MTPPTACLCLTGSELTRGDLRDSNGAWLAARLTDLGLRVAEIAIVPDDPGAMEACFGRAIAEADLVLISGGLGPTEDDRTIEVLARVTGRGVAPDAEARERMRERALRRVASEAEIPANFYKQCEVVEGARVLPNPVGLAPGCALETSRGLVIALPGVPRELEAIFSEHAAGLIDERFRLVPPRVLAAVVLGLGESWVESRVQSLPLARDGIEYSIRARPGEVTLKFVAPAPAPGERLARIREQLAEEFGDDIAILPEDAPPEAPRAGHAHARRVHELLLEKGWTVATAESCTGGLIAAGLTDHAGASGTFLGSVVAYANRAKEDLLGVDPALIEREGAVSEPVARALAEGARRRFGADFGVGVTGIAGPGGGTSEKPVGTVWIALSGPASPPGRSPSSPMEETTAVEHRFAGPRPAVRERAAVAALELLRRRALELSRKP